MTAGPVDPQTIQFLAGKGIDASHQVSKALEQIPERDQLHLVVSLDVASQRALPQRPAKTLGIDWYVPDPSKLRARPAEVAVAYEEAFASLSAHIKDLLQAILDDPRDEQTK
jgi:protein-tyrosine-phosphatase